MLKLPFAMHYSFDLLSVSVLDSYLYHIKILPRLWQSLQWNQGNAVIIHYVNSPEFQSFLFIQSHILQRDYQKHAVAYKNKQFERTWN